MRTGFFVCLVVAAGCSDSGSDGAMPMFGTQAGGPADNVGPLPAPAGPPNGMVQQPAPAPPGPVGPPAVQPTDPVGPDPQLPMGGMNPGPQGPAPAQPEPGPGPEPMTDPMPNPTGPTPQTCAAGLSGSSGRTVERIQHAGVTREFILHVPDSYTGQEPMPLMVNFHPLLSDGAAAERGSGYKALADREGFIVAFPSGQESAAWNVGPCCTASRDVDDVGFVRALVANVQASHCVDEKRIYASGFSMGGGMAHYVGCEAADLFAAIAPGAFDLFEENTCAPARPLTVIAFRSTSDVIVPYAGGRKESAPNGFRGTHTFLGAVNTFERWAEINGCTGQPVNEGGGCDTYKECTDGVEVTLCTVPGGHVWPDAERSWETISRFSLP